MKPKKILKKNNKKGWCAVKLRSHPFFFLQNKLNVDVQSPQEQLNDVLQIFLQELLYGAMQFFLCAIRIRADYYFLGIEKAMEVVPVIMMFGYIQDHNTFSINTGISFEVTQGIGIIKTVMRNSEIPIHKITSLSLGFPRYRVRSRYPLPQSADCAFYSVYNRKGRGAAGGIAGEVLNRKIVTLPGIEEPVIERPEGEHKLLPEGVAQLQRPDQKPKH